MISIILPAYQEEKNLETILPQLHSCLSDIEHEIIVIDTMESMDDTKNVCAQYDATYVNRSGGNYYGDAIRTGISCANGEYIVAMDADGSHDPAYIIDFYYKCKNEGYDLVIGSRYCKGGHTDNTIFSKLLSLFTNVVFRVIFDLKVNDVSDSFRMYRAKEMRFILENGRDEWMKANGYGMRWKVECTFSDPKESSRTC